MSNFLKDEETSSELTTVPEVSKIAEGSDASLRDYVQLVAIEIGKSAKEHRSALRKHERVLYGYENESGDKVLGLIDRVKELESWKRKWEENEKKIRYAIAGFAVAGPIVIALLTVVLRAILAKMGLKI